MTIPLSTLRQGQGRSLYYRDGIDSDFVFQVLTSNFLSNYPLFERRGAGGRVASGLDELRGHRVVHR